MPTVAYQHHRFRVRFAAHQAALPAPVLEQVRGFLARLPASQRKMARTALCHQLGAAVPWTEVRIPRYRRNRARLAATIFEPAELRRLATALRGARDRALVSCCWLLRRAEVARLRWTHVDRRTGMVYVWHGKGDKSDATLFPPEARAACRAWYDAAGRPPETALVFPGGRRSRGQPVRPGTVGQWISAILTRADLRRPWRNAHAFRRTFASRYLSVNPDDLEGLRGLLRQDSIETTIEYVFLRPGDFRRRLARVQLGFNGLAHHKGRRRP